MGRWTGSDSIFTDIGGTLYLLTVSGVSTKNRGGLAHTHTMAKRLCSLLYLSYKKRDQGIG